MINTLQYAKKLEGVGYTREQAEAHVTIMVEVVEDQLVTKEDFKNLRDVTKQDFKDLREVTKQDFNDLRDITKQDFRDLRVEIDARFDRVDQEFRAVRYEMQQLEQRMTIKLGGMLAAGIAIIATLIHLKI
jgi:hypothetical protein